MMKNRKAISPVIATVILVAVAITIAVAVSYWMSGIAGQYTKFEKVEIQSGYAELQPTPGGWVVTLELKNSGSASANLIKVFVNDKPVDLYGTTFTLTQEPTPVAAESIGNTGTIGALVFAGGLAKKPVQSQTLLIKVDGAVVLTDVAGTGILSGTGVSGTINYATGAWTATFTTAPTASKAITADYTYILGAKTGTNIPEAGVAIDSGKTADVSAATGVQPVQVFIGSGLFSSGTTVDIKIHSAGGMDYIKLIQLV